MTTLSAPRRPPGGPGFALAYVVIAVGIVAVLFLGFFTFRSHAIRASSSTADELLARQAAEAGLNAVLGEMQINRRLMTHGKAVVTRDPSGRLDRVEFTQPRRPPDSQRMVRAQAAGPLTDVRIQGDTYRGLIGQRGGFGQGFEAEFRVRWAPLTIERFDPETDHSIDVKTRFIQLVSLGRRRDEFVRIAATVEASNLTEYTIYDGAFLHLGMGSTGDSGNSNVFSVGRLYGATHTAIANIESSGTRQAFFRMGPIFSGGPVLFYQDTFQVPFGRGTSPSSHGPGDSSAWKVRGTGAPGSDSNLAEGWRRGMDLDPARRNQLKQAGGYVLDGEHGGSQPPPAVPQRLFQFMKDNPSRFPVVILSAASESGNPALNRPCFKKSVPYANPHGSGTFQAAVLCLGKAVYTGTGDDPVRRPEREILIYNDLENGRGNPRPLVVWGHPDRDVSIYSPGDIYIAGDLNQKEDHHQAYLPPTLNARAVAYKERARFVQGDEGDEGLSRPEPNWEAPRRPDAQAERRACAVVSDQRIWLDYRFPSRLLENEIRPYVLYLVIAAFKAAEGLRTEPGAADKQFAYGFIADYRAPKPAGEPITRSHRPTPTEPAFDDALRNRLFLSSVSPEVQQAFNRLGTAVALRDVEPVVDALMDTLASEEKTTINATSGWWRLAHDYYNRLVPGAASGGDPTQRSNTFDGISVDAATWKDRLYLPEQTVNAMLVDSAHRNSQVWEPLPNSVNKWFNEIGNASGSGAAQYLPYCPPTAGPSPIIGRIYGSEIRLCSYRLDPRTGDITPVVVEPRLGLNSHYRPHKRKRIFDRALRFHPPPYLPRTFKVLAWDETGVRGGRAEFESFR